MRLLCWSYVASFSRKWMVALLLLAGCRSPAPRSAVQDVAPAPAPSWAVSRSAPMEQIRYILKPARPPAPIFKYLSGIQYLHGEVKSDKMGLVSGAIAMTLDDAEVDGNSLAIPLYDKPNYAYKLDSAPELTRAPGHPAYKIFMKDDKHATIITGTWVNGKFQASPDASSDVHFGDMTMEMVEAYHWVRHTARLPDYDLYTIIDADGKPTPYYRIFVNDINTSGYKKFTFYVPANSDLGRGGPLPTGPQPVKDDQASPSDDAVPIYQSADDAADGTSDNSSTDSSKALKSGGTHGR